MATRSRPTPPTVKLPAAQWPSHDLRVRPTILPSGHVALAVEHGSLAFSVVVCDGVPAVFWDGEG